MASACAVLDGTAGSLTVHTDGITSPGQPVASIVQNLDSITNSILVRYALK
jgi:hypothetical protein